MAGESDNLATAGTDNAQPSTSVDNPDNWNFLDPDEDNEEVTDEAGTEGEADEIETHDQEAEKSEETDEEQTDDKSEDEDQPDEESSDDDVKDDVQVTLQDGTQVQLSELKQGYMRQADHTRKSQENANKRREIEANADLIGNTIEAFTDFLAKQIPDEPDIALSLSNPSEYVAQKARYDATLAQVQSLIEMGSKPKEAVEKLSETDHRETLMRENQALVAMFPEAGSDKTREQFFGNVFDGARQLGFSDAEIQSATDHRLIGLSYWAKKGMEAEKAKSKAKEKAKGAPPVAPKKRSKGEGAKAVSNRDAMKRLASTGSIHDALAVDWD